MRYSITLWFFPSTLFAFIFLVPTIFPRSLFNFVLRLLSACLHQLNQALLVLCAVIEITDTIRLQIVSTRKNWT